MKKIYLILIAVLVFSCSADEDKECTNTISADSYVDEFAYFEDKPLKITSVTILNELNQIISEEIYNGEACGHNSVYTFRKNREYNILWGVGVLSEPQGCSLSDTDNWVNYKSTWKPVLRIETKKDCTTENVLQISTSYGHDADPVLTFKQFTVTINGNSLIFNRTYFVTDGVSSKRRTERTTYVIINP